MRIENAFHPNARVCKICDVLFRIDQIPLGYEMVGCECGATGILKIFPLAGLDYECGFLSIAWIGVNYVG